MKHLHYLMAGLAYYALIAVLVLILHFSEDVLFYISLMIPVGIRPTLVFIGLISFTLATAYAYGRIISRSK